MSGWEPVLFGTGLGICGGLITTCCMKTKCYCKKKTDDPLNCSSCECGAGFTKKSLIVDGDNETEIQIIHINGVDLAYVGKLGNFIHKEDITDSD